MYKQKRHQSKREFVMEYIRRWGPACRAELARAARGYQTMFDYALRSLVREGSLYRQETGPGRPVLYLIRERDI